MMPLIINVGTILLLAIIGLVLRAGKGAFLIEVKIIDLDETNGPKVGKAYQLRNNPIILSLKYPGKNIHKAYLLSQTPF